MMDDSISRKMTIDAMCILMNSWFGGDLKDEREEIKWIINHLPSAQPQYDEEWRKKHYETSYSQGYVDGYKMCEKRLPRWIPCSERLPEEKDAGILKKLGIEKRSEDVLATVEVKGERMTVTACTL